MENSESVDRLFYELASESRLSILLELQKKNQRMQEIARKLDLTDTEAFRQLQRLNEALLIQKQPDGAYAITQYGKLVLQFSHSFDFAFKFKQVLLTRDIWRIPEPFIDRLGELSNCLMSTDTIEMLNGAEQLISNAEKYFWFIAEKPMSMMGEKVTAQLEKSKFSIRFLFDEQSRTLFEPVPDIPGLLEKRVIPLIPVTLLMTEKFAGVNLLSIDGRADATIFYGNDPKFLRWATDLFNYFWEQGKRCYPNVTP